MELTQSVLDASASVQVAPLQFGGGFIELAILFVILAVVAAVVGASGVAGVSMTIAKWFVIIFVVLAVVSLVI
jgi:uncharacterized membrane protein YtjA (UPF0391 family)